MKKLTRNTDLRSFIGLVGFYSDVFPQRAHILAPLISLGNLPKGKNLWRSECSEAFEKMKSIVAADCLLTYPDHNKMSYIYTDASDFQLSAVIMQQDYEGILRPVAYFSQKLTPAQCNYTTSFFQWLWYLNNTGPCFVWNWATNVHQPQNPNVWQLQHPTSSLLVVLHWEIPLTVILHQREE